FACACERHEVSRRVSTIDLTASRLIIKVLTLKAELLASFSGSGMRRRGSNNKFEKQDLSYADLDESSLKHTKPPLIRRWRYYETSLDKVSIFSLITF